MLLQNLNIKMPVSEEKSNKNDFRYFVARQLQITLKFFSQKNFMHIFEFSAKNPSRKVTIQKETKHFPKFGSVYCPQ